MQRTRSLARLRLVSSAAAAFTSSISRTAKSPSSSRSFASSVTKQSSSSSSSRKKRSGSSSSSSALWLARQKRDPYVAARAPAGYRARAAFKLVELDEKYRLLGFEGVGGADAGGKENAGREDEDDDGRGDRGGEKRARKMRAQAPPQVVVDLGAAPGGWSQVVAEKLGVGALDDVDADADSDSTRTRTLQGAAGRPPPTIIAFDLLPIAPLPGVHILQGDFLAPDAGARIAALLPSASSSSSSRGILKTSPHPNTLAAHTETTRAKVDLVLSDIAANASGNKVRDDAAALAVCEGVYAFARAYLRRWDPEAGSGGGCLVLKHFQSASTRTFQREVLRPVFRQVFVAKPRASRAESSECYFVCKGFRGDDRPSAHEEEEEYMDDGSGVGDWMSEAAGVLGFKA